MVLDVLVKPPEPFITKVMPPKRPFGLVRRERLLRVLARAVDRHRAVLVTAPAGYGKTSLVSDFIADLTAPVCWYSIEPEDNGARAFVQFLVTAIKRQFPEFGDGTLHLLSTSPDLALTLPTVLGTLVSEIQEQISDWFVLVLEDLHSCTDPVAVSALDLLLRHLPDNCFIIMTSRAQPPMGALSRLTAQRSLTRITIRELAFKENEVVELLALSGHEVDPELTKRLTAESEGWIAGIILLTPWLDEPPALAALDVSGNHEDLFQYLSEDIFQRLPLRWQDFLVRTSVVQDVSVDMCVEALDFSDAPGLLCSMEAAGLFLAELDDGSTYRYHALFREFLLARAMAEPRRLAETRHRIAEFYSSRGRWSEAVNQYLAGGLPDAAAAVLERGAPEWYQRGEWAQLAELIARVEHYRAGYPTELSLWRGRCLLQIGHPDIALGLVEEFEQAYRTGRPAIAAALAEIVRSGALRNKGSITEAMAAARRALHLTESAQETPLVSLLCAEAHHYIGVCLATAGHSQEAIRELDLALGLFTTQGNVHQIARTHSVLGNALYRLGYYPAAIAHYERAIEGSRQLGNLTALASTLNNLGNLYMCLGSFALAQDVLRSSLEASRQCSNTRIEAYATQSLGDTLAGLARFEEAASVLRDAITLCRRAGETVLEARTRLGLARACARLNSFEEAEQLLGQADALMSHDPTPYSLGLLSFSSAVLRIVRKDFAAARRDLSESLKHFDVSGDVRWRERTALLLAQCVYKLGDTVATATYLQRVREAAQSDVGPSALRQEALLAQDVLKFAVDTQPDGGAFVQLCAMADAACVLPSEVARTASTRTMAKPLVKAFGLGNFSIELDGCPLDDATHLTPKAKELLFYLLASGRQVRREELLEAIWPEVATTKDSSVLRTNVYRLRKVLYDECIVVQGDSYRIDPAGNFWLDLHYFKELVQRAQQARCSAVERLLLLETAVQIYRGPFLEAVTSDWCVAERYDVEIRFASASLALAEMYLAKDQSTEAIPLCERVLTSDPTNEDAILLLAQAYVAQGDRAAATLHWRSFERRLQAEMGNPPSREANSRFQQLVHS